MNTRNSNLFTNAIEQELQKQFPMGSSLEQQIVVKLFNPSGSWTWYLMNQDPNNPDYLWGIVDGFEVEMGSVSKKELEDLRVPPFNMPLERDLFFKPVSAREIWEKLNNGEKP